MKKLEFKDFGRIPEIVPAGATKAEANACMAQHYARRAKYYADIPYNEDMAKWCTTVSLIYAPSRPQ